MLFTDEELKVFAVSRSLAGALKALIDVPILDDGEISQEAEQKYQTVLNSLPSYENNVKEIQTVAKGLKVNVKKEKQLLLEPVADALWKKIRNAREEKDRLAHLPMDGVIRPLFFLLDFWLPF